MKKKCCRHIIQETKIWIQSRVRIVKSIHTVPVYENKTKWNSLFTQHSPATPTSAGQRKKILKGQKVFSETYVPVGFTSDHFYFGSSGRIFINSWSTRCTLRIHLLAQPEEIQFVHCSVNHLLQAGTINTFSQKQILYSRTEMLMQMNPMLC